jgi:hypothetical protein
MTEKIGVALDLMRLEGICKMLISSLDEDALESKYLSITGRAKVDNVKKALAKLSKAELRRIIEMSPAITEETIINFYNEYRYGRKPGYILYWANGFIGKTIDTIALKMQLSQLLEQKRYNDDARFKDLKCVAVEEWTEIGSTVIEVGLSYLKKYSYINADNSFDYIHELMDCFAWISVDKGFVALYNMPPTIESIIKKTILSLYGVRLLGLSLDNDTLNAIFDSSKRKKISLTHHMEDSNKPQKATFSDARFAEKQDAVLADYGDYGIDSSLYDIEIDEETIATLGVNSNKGKLYINKNLRTTQFRKWSVSNISTIIEYFSKIFSTDGAEKFQHVQLFTGSEWGRLSAGKKEVLSSIAVAILMCKEKGVNQYPIEIPAPSVKSAFPKDTSSCFLAFCDQCNETIIPECPDCQGKFFEVANANFLCDSCKRSLSHVKCECGNFISTDDTDAIMSVALNDDFLGKVVSELHSVKPGLSLAEHEYIAVHNGYLRIFNSDGFKRIHPKDLSPCTDLYRHDLPETFVADAKKLFKKLNEKCNDAPTNEDCEECRYKKVASIHDLQCLQQLLCYFDDFAPSPHHGHEYGDVSISVSMDGKTYNLQGIMKSDTSKITRSGKTGREIIDQVIKALFDGRTEIICILAPTQIDKQLSETILTLAKNFNKKLVFWDFDFMVRLAYAYQKRLDDTSTA